MSLQVNQHLEQSQSWSSSWLRHLVSVLRNLNKYLLWVVAAFCWVTNEEQSKICIIQQYHLDLPLLFHEIFRHLAKLISYWMLFLNKLALTVSNLFWWKLTREGHDSVPRVFKCDYLFKIQPNKIWRNPIYERWWIRYVVRRSSEGSN